MRTRSLALLVVALLAATAVAAPHTAADPGYTPPTTATFSDVSTSHDSFTAVEWMNATGIDTGFTDGTYKPNDYGLRHQIAAWFYRFADYVADPSVDSFVAPSTASFTDVPTTHEHFTEVEWFADNVLAPPGTLFKPNDLVTRQVMARYLSPRRSAMSRRPTATTPRSSGSATSTSPTGSATAPTDPRATPSAAPRPICSSATCRCSTRRSVRPSASLARRLPPTS
jgi:hypothetical protein